MTKLVEIQEDEDSLSTNNGWRKSHPRCLKSHHVSGDADLNNNALKKFIRQLHVFANEFSCSSVGIPFATNSRVALDSIGRE